MTQTFRTCLIALLLALIFGPVARANPVDLAAVGGEVPGAVIDGVRAGDLAGRAITSLDFNGDGIFDFAVSAQGFDRRDAQGNITGGNVGIVYVIFGRPGLDLSQFPLSSLEPGNGGDGSAGFVLIGGQGNEQVGNALANAGDPNNDGIDDLLIGSANFIGNFNNGGAYLLFGRREPMPAVIEPADLLTADNSNSGLGTLLQGSQASGAAGRDVAGVGDINADGLDDLVIGNFYFTAGQAPRPAFTYVVYGRQSTADWPAFIDMVQLQSNVSTGLDGFTVVSDVQQNGLGSVVTALGDYTGDGLADFFLGSPFASSSTGVQDSAGFLIPGRPSGPGEGFDTVLDLQAEQARITTQRIRGDQLDDNAGFDAAGLGDINGDGRPDLAISANLAEHGGPDSGAVYVLFGRPPGSGLAREFDLASLLAANGGDGSRGFVVIGSANQQLGDAVSPAGDLNGDGLIDLAIGARFDDSGGADAGAVYLVYGRPSFPPQITVSQLADPATGLGLMLVGESAGDQVGDTLSPVGDVSASGAGALALSGRLVDVAGSNAGRVYLLAGSSTAVAFTGEASRAWYHPQRSGEGVLIEVGTLSGEPVLFVTWYTYRDGEPFWLAGGPQPFAAGATEVTVPLIRTAGADFGDAFDAAEVTTAAAGQVVVSLDACDRLGWRYSGGDGLDDVTLTFEPLLADQLGLAGCLDAKGVALDNRYAGAWWNPSRAGEGIVLDLETRGATPTAFMSWFTYLAGQPVWLVGSAPFAPSDSVLNIPLVVTRGAQFGEAFSAADVVVNSWGTAVMQFTGCNAAQINFSGQFEGGSPVGGSIELQRFTDGLLTLPCVR